MHSTRLLIADDDAAARAMIRDFLEKDWEIVGEAENGAEAVNAAEQLRPDIVLMDISMPVMGGFAAAKELKEKMPGLLIIFVSQHPDTAYIEEAFRIGASGYVLKRLAVRDLTAAIEHVRAGGTFRSATGKHMTAEP
jgi:DNA-binding NarL/FixJ family response regulator